MTKEELRKSIEALENPTNHIHQEKDDSLSYSFDLVRAFEIAIELMQHEEQQFDENKELLGL